MRTFENVLIGSGFMCAGWNLMCICENLLLGGTKGMLAVSVLSTIGPFICAALILNTRK